MTTETDDLNYYEHDLPKIIAGVRRGEKWELEALSGETWYPKEGLSELLACVSAARRVRLAPVPVVKTMTVDELIENYDDLREFVRVICLQLQKHRGLSDGQKDELFQLSYRKYVQHDVEKQPRPCVKPEGGK